MANPRTPTCNSAFQPASVAVALVLIIVLLASVADAQLREPWSNATGTEQSIQTRSLALNHDRTDASPSNGLQFFPAVECRVVDTRNPNGTFGGPPIQGRTSRSFPIPQGSCNIPSTAGAYVLTVTVIPMGQLSLLTVYPTGESLGAVTTMVSLDGRIKSDPTIVPAGTNEAVSVYASDTTNVVIDVYGYFAPASQSSMQFYPLAPCRVVDTRQSGQPLPGGQEADFPVLESPCIPTGLQPEAYSMNFTAIPPGALNSLTVWPTGQQRPLVVTLTDPIGTIVSDAGIIAAGLNGAISVFPSGDTHLVIDINGYFAPPGAGGLSLYPTAAPCHAFASGRSVFDSGFSGMTVIPISLPRNPCGLPETAQGFVFNATVYPRGLLGYLTLWPDGEPQPVVANLSALDGTITSNMAIIPNLDGYTDAYASNTTQLALDIMTYFAP